MSKRKVRQRKIQNIQDTEYPRTSQTISGSNTVFSSSWIMNEILKHKTKHMVKIACNQNNRRRYCEMPQLMLGIAINEVSRKIDTTQSNASTAHVLILKIIQLLSIVCSQDSCKKTPLVFAHPSTDRAEPTRATIGTDRLLPKLEHWSTGHACPSRTPPTREALEPTRPNCVANKLLPSITVFNTDEPVPTTPDAVETLEPSQTKPRTLRVLPYVPLPKTKTEESPIAIPKVEKCVSHSS